MNLSKFVDGDQAAGRRDGPPCDRTSLRGAVATHCGRDVTDEPATHAPAESTRTEELRSFLFFTVVMAPVLAVAVVGGYGFLVWMYQLMAGPPGA